MTRNSILYGGIDFLVRAGTKLNLVEILKDIVGHFAQNGGSQDTVILAKRRTIELFIFFKWILVAFLWTTQAAGNFWSLVVGYLLISNLHSYFCHHVWIIEGTLTPERQRLRFIAVLQAIAFNIVCFAYFYKFTFNGDFNWGSFNSTSSLVNLSFSTLNTLGGGSNVASPVTNAGVVLLGAQMAVTFLFLTIILSRSPTAREDS